MTIPPQTEWLRTKNMHTIHPWSHALHHSIQKQISYSGKFGWFGIHLSLLYIIGHSHSQRKIVEGYQFLSKFSVITILWSVETRNKMSDCKSYRWWWGWWWWWRWWRWWWCAVLLWANQVVTSVTIITRPHGQSDAYRHLRAVNWKERRTFHRGWDQDWFLFMKSLGNQNIAGPFEDL